MSEAITQFHRGKAELESNDPAVVERREVANALRQKIRDTGDKIGELGGVGLHLINQIASGDRSIDDLRQ